MKPEYYIYTPATALQPYVSLYWLGKNSVDSSYPVLPDGSVDLVLRIEDCDAEAKLFGTTTHPTLIDIAPRCTYLGIRFQPGQSRHFISLPALELTDLATADPHLLNLRLENIHHVLHPQAIAAYLDKALLAHLHKQPPAALRIDRVIQQMEQLHGQFSIDEAAAALCKSRRQFERIFKETVGLTPKTYNAICRLRHASQLIHTCAETSLAEIAFNAGFADQSHMNRQFKRLTGVTPTRIHQQHVAFVQYAP